MYVIVLQVALLSSLTLVGGANRKRSGVIPGRIQGEVLEVFDNNQVLISFGSYQGAAKGMTVFLDRLGPSYLWRVPFAELELVAVGSRHSVGQMKSRSPHTKIQVDDFAWVPSSRERALFAPCRNCHAYPALGNAAAPSST